MEQSIEVRVRRVTKTLYDLVILRDGDVEVRHSVSYSWVQDYVRMHCSSLLNKLPVAGSINFQSKVKFM